MSLDPEKVRQFHRRFATGVTVVTVMEGDEPRGLAVNAFTSVSLEPPVIMVCVNRKASTAPTLQSADHFAVNMLASDQVEIARRFARSGGDKFEGLAWQPGRSGVPLLDGVAAHLEAAVEQRIPAYTHTIYIARVVEAETNPKPPLVYLEGRFIDAATLDGNA